jgi:hypothetical protein
MGPRLETPTEYGWVRPHGPSKRRPDAGDGDRRIGQRQSGVAERRKKGSFGVMIGSKITESQAALAACVAIMAGELKGRTQASSAALASSLVGCEGHFQPPPTISHVPKGTLTPCAFAVLSVIPRPDTGTQRSPGNTSGRF